MIKDAIANIPKRDRLKLFKRCRLQPKFEVDYSPNLEASVGFRCFALAEAQQNSIRKVARAFERREILATCPLRGLPNGLACREPDADNLNETLGVAIDLTMDFFRKRREEIWRTRSRIWCGNGFGDSCSAGFRAQTGCGHSVAGPRSTGVP